MKTLILLALIAPALLFGQAANRATQKAAIDSAFPSNVPGAITASSLRTITKQMIDSAYNALDDGAPGTSWPAGTQEIWVSVSGNDTTGNGTALLPYLTITKAISTITDATVTKTYIVHVGAGRFSETALVLKPNVWIIGNGNDQGGPTRITVTGTPAAVTPDPSFASITGSRAGISNCYFRGGTGLSFDLTTQTGTGSTILEVDNATFTGDVTYKAKTSGDGLDWRNGVCFGTVTLQGGGSQTFLGVVATGNVVLSDGSGANNIGFQMFGGAVGGNLTCMTTGTGASTVQFIGSNISGNLTMTQTSGTLQVLLDPPSYPVGTVTVNSGTLTKTGKADSILGTVSAVSPTAPNRTISVVIGGTTYYLAAKTTND